jgi:uncharacterized membrane protein
MVKIFLNSVYNKKKPSFSDLFIIPKSKDNTIQLLKYFATYTILVMGTILGFILLIIPGIYFSLKYRYASYEVVQNNTGIVEAFSNSGKITDGIK